VRSRALGGQGLEVSALGFGCGGLSNVYGSGGEAGPRNAVHRAFELGVTLFDLADVYGNGQTEQLVGRVLASYREQVILASKAGLVGSGDGRDFRVDGSPAHLREACEGSLRRLSTDRIDLYYLHRPDPTIPIEESVGAMSELVEAGKVRFLGLSEAGADTLERAHAVHPIAALQSEWSLWCRDIEDGVLDVARGLGIGIVPYAPLGRGFLTGTVASPASFETQDVRRLHPRFDAGNFERNLALLRELEGFADGFGITVAQLALAWVLAQGSDVVPIPGTKDPAKVTANVAAADVRLSDTDIERLTQLIPRMAWAGARYDGATGVEGYGTTPHPTS
jgi:aryl-alcohol dehydrogenase-like predicted oxidoreductase